MSNSKLIDDAVHVLKDHGQTAQQFITSSLQRFPVEGEPDLVFVPHGSDKAFVIEMKFSGKELGLEAIEQAARNSDAIQSANAGQSITLLIAADVPVSEFIKGRARERNIQVIDDVRDGFQLAKSLLAVAHHTGPGPRRQVG